MMRIIFLIACSIGIQYNIFSQSFAISDDVKRIVFLGNSITYQGKYIAFIDAYFSIHYPDKHYEIINAGLPSETVSGLSEPGHAKGKYPRPDLHDRLHRVVAETKPDLVLACYGMNDGIYLPFSEKRFKKYKKGIYRLHKAIEKSGAEIIHITPPVYDGRKGEAYANVLDIYSDWLISNRYTKGWNVIDIHWPMKKKLEDHRRIDSTFVFAKDGIHPNDTGHFEMAKQILEFFVGPPFSTTDDINGFLSAHQNAAEIFNLVQLRQRITKDAWLTHIGHKRPNMKKGLPMDEAQAKSKEIEAKIQLLIQKE
ncbi:MAG: SGNH/GDSL hydrolase family protein [Bacteroidales bacterium]|nr:SGNH/GDSL hydrolase family protein [Bacteroidales bacterium]